MQKACNCAATARLAPSCVGKRGQTWWAKSCKCPLDLPSSRSHTGCMDKPLTPPHPVDPLAHVVGNSKGIFALNHAPSWLELESVQPLGVVEKATSLSRDTVKRRYKKYVVKLAARREGMKLRHILQITTGTLP